MKKSNFQLLNTDDLLNMSVYVSIRRHISFGFGIQCTYYMYHSYLL